MTVRNSWGSEQQPWVSPPDHGRRCIRISMRDINWWLWESVLMFKPRMDLKQQWDRRGSSENFPLFIWNQMIYYAKKKTKLLPTLCLSIKCQHTSGTIDNMQILTHKEFFSSLSWLRKYCYVFGANIIGSNKRHVMLSIWLQNVYLPNVLTLLIAYHVKAHKAIEMHN